MQDLNATKNIDKLRMLIIQGKGDARTVRYRNKLGMTYRDRKSGGVRKIERERGKERRQERLRKRMCMCEREGKKY
jgi:hypothetical protein